MTTSSNVEINGIPYLLEKGTYRRSSATQFAPKVGSGDTKHQDYTVKSVITQDTFHGGRGDKEFEDVSRFFDSENVQTRIKRQVTLSPRPTVIGIGTANYPEYECAAASQEELTAPSGIGQEAVDPDLVTYIYGINKAAVKFTCPAGGLVISGFSANIARAASNTGRNIKGTIYTGASAPTTPVTNATATVGWSTVPTSATWVRFNFIVALQPISVTLTAGTDYWIVLEDESGTGAVPRYYWYGQEVFSTSGAVFDYTYDGTWHQIGVKFDYRFGCVRRMLSQKFTMGGTSPANDKTVTYLRLKARVTNIPSQPKSITVRIETDNAGAPSGTLVTNASFTLSTDSLSTSWAMVKTSVNATAATLTGGTVYHIVVYRPDDASQDDDSWDMEWADDNVGTTYAGTAAYKDYPTDTWHALTGDFAFRVETGLASLGSVSCFCHFFGNVYAAVGCYLYKLDNNGTSWSLVQYGSSPYAFPAPIKDLFAYNAAGTDNQQVITGTATSGGWDLTFNGKTISNLSYNASASGLQSSMETLLDDKVKPGDVTCEGGPLGTSPIVVTLEGQYLAGKVPIITAASNSGSPLGGGTVTVTAPAAYMFIALGNNTPMVTMKADGTFTTATSPKSKMFGTLRQRLYRVEKSSLSYNTDGQVADANWTTSAHVGNASTKITGLAELDGVLYIAKEEGLYKLLSDQEAMLVVSWADQEDPVNGRSMKAWQGNLIFPIGHGLMKFTAGQITPFGLDMDEGLPSGKLGKVKCIVSTMQTLYVAVAGDENNVSGIYEYNGVGWHNLYTSTVKDSPITAMCYTTTFAGQNRLWFSQGNDVYYMLIPDVTGNPANWMDDNEAGLATFVDSGFLETGWIEAGLPEVTKSWINLATDTETPAACSIDVYYHCDDSTEYRKLTTISANGVSSIRFPLVRNIGGHKVITSSATPTTTVFDVADDSGIVAGDVIVINGHERIVSTVTTHTVDTVDYDQITISTGLPVAPEVGDLVFSAGKAGKRIRLKFVLSTTDITKTPILKRWTLGLLARPETTWAWQFQVRVQENMENLDGSGEYPYTLAQVLDNLRIPTETPMPVDFKDPDGVSYEVFMTSQVEQERSTYLDENSNEAMERIISVALMELD